MALQGTPSGQRQKMNQGDTLITLLKVPTNEKAMWRGREKEASRGSITVPPPAFSCLTSVQLFVQLYLFYKIRAKNTPKKKQNKTIKQRPTGEFSRLPTLPRSYKDD